MRRVSGSTFARLSFFQLMLSFLLPFPLCFHYFSLPLFCFSFVSTLFLVVISCFFVVCLAAVACSQFLAKSDRDRIGGHKIRRTSKTNKQQQQQQGKEGEKQRHTHATIVSIVGLFSRLFSCLDCYSVFSAPLSVCLSAMSLSKHSNDSNDSCTPASCCSGIEGMWKSYLHQLVVNPVRTKALTSCFAASLATVVAQLSVGVPIGNINWTAVKNQAIIGFIRGPTTHYWSHNTTTHRSHTMHEPGRVSRV